MSTDLDMTDTIIPKSDQLNADDLMTGPRTFTIADVRKTGSAEQPVDVLLSEFPPGRPFKPSKSMRRVMVAAWGADAHGYVGHRLTLYRDPTVRFGGQDVGGLRISHMSHIDKPLTLALTVTRGKRAPYRVEPLPDEAPSHPVVTADTLAEMEAMFARKGSAKESQLPWVNWCIGGSATDLETITEQEARKVIEALSHRPDVAPAAFISVDDGPNSTAELPITEEPEGWGKK
jgi:hypothetical protein